MVSSIPLAAQTTRSRMPVALTKRRPSTDTARPAAHVEAELVVAGAAAAAATFVRAEAARPRKSSEAVSSRTASEATSTDKQPPATLGACLAVSDSGYLREAR